MKSCISEAELAQRVVAELQQSGFVVYQEVSAGYGMHRADIVAVGDHRACIIETKTSFTLQLVEQGLRWQPMPVILASPSGKATHKKICASTGLGMWQIGSNTITEHVAPRPWRGSKKWIAGFVKEAQRSGEYAPAGSRGGGYYTPFRETCHRLRAIVDANPGIGLKQAIDGTKHHYSSNWSARQNLAQLIRKGVVKGIRIDEVDGVKLYPKVD